MTDSIKLSLLLPATPEEVFDAYLDARLHAAMTGAPANGEPTVGAVFTAWDGYISGKNVLLERPRRIVQTWSTTDFPARAKPSNLTIELSEHDGETKLTLTHKDLPAGTGARFTDGWRDFYFIPMEDFFGKGGASSVKAAPKKPAAKKPAAKEPAAKKPAAKKPGPRR